MRGYVSVVGDVRSPFLRLGNKSARSTGFRAIAEPGNASHLHLLDMALHRGEGYYVSLYSPLMLFRRDHGYGRLIGRAEEPV